MSTPQPVNDQAPAEGWVSMRHLQRATVFAKAAGLGVDELLAHPGLAQAQLADTEQLVPLHAIEAMLNALQRQQGDRLFGLHMATNIQPSTLGAIGHILQACSTFADLIDVVVRYNGLLSNIGHTSVIHAPGLVELRWECLAGSPLFRRHASEDVRRLITALVIAGNASKEAVALQLGTSPRSLHRHLQEAGTSYQELLDSVRLALAREQLASSVIPIAEITEQLGFSSRQSFMRWFRQMTGITPSQHRALNPT